MLAKPTALECLEAVWGTPRVKPGGYQRVEITGRQLAIQKHRSSLDIMEQIVRVRRKAPSRKAAAKFGGDIERVDAPGNVVITNLLNFEVTVNILNVIAKFGN